MIGRLTSPGPVGRGTARRHGGGAVLVALRSGQKRIGLVLLVTVVALALVGPSVAPRGETEYVGRPSTAHVEGAPFGTDHLGQDVWSRFLIGGRSLLVVAALATALGVAAGATVALTAAVARPRVAGVVVRGVDALLAVPQLLLVLVAMTTVGPEPWIVVATVALTTAPRVARVVHTAASEVARRDFVQVSQALGEGRIRIMVFDLLPNVSGPLLGEASIRFTYAVGIVASLAFLGFVPDPTSADWGSMVQENRTALGIQPWGVVLPMVGVTTLALGAGLVADGLARSISHGGRR